MSFGVNLLLLVCMFPVLPIMYFAMKFTFKEESGVFYGVKIPKEQRKNEEVLQLHKKYNRMMNWITIALLPFPILPFFFDSFAVGYTIYMMWMLAVIVLLCVPYMLGFQAFKKLKKERGWYQEKPISMENNVLIDTKVLVEEETTSRKLPFLIATILSFVPVGYVVYKFMLKQMVVDDLVGVVSISLITPLLWWASYLMTHARMKVVSSESAINQQLRRVRKYHWTKAFVGVAWANVIYAWLFAYHFCIEESSVIWILTETMVYSCMILYFMIDAELKVRRVRNKVEAQKESQFEMDEEDHWILGMFYYNENDPKTMVEKRVGIGTTMNMARPIAKWISLFVVLAMLSLPISCVWIFMEERTPIRLEIVNEELVSSHIHTEYELPISKMESLELIDELPHTYKKNGTGMDHLLKGTFRVDGYGTSELCLNPSNQSFIVIESEQGLFIVSAATDEETEEIFEAAMLIYRNNVVE